MIFGTEVHIVDYIWCSYACLKGDLKGWILYSIRLPAFDFQKVLYLSKSIMEHYISQKFEWNLLTSGTQLIMSIFRLEVLNILIGLAVPHKDSWNLQNNKIIRFQVHCKGSRKLPLAAPETSFSHFFVCLKHCIAISFCALSTILGSIFPFLCVP